MWGLTEDEGTLGAEIWPDNLQAINVFISMSTQWRSSGFGTTGLDYGALPAVLRMSGIPRAQWSDIFESIRILEDWALHTMRKNK